MPRYDFECSAGHREEHEFSMAEVPAAVRCSCRRKARRVFAPPAAIHFRGPGFYSTDVNGRIHRKRRPNPGDDLHREFDHAAARIADGI